MIDVAVLVLIVLGGVTATVYLGDALVQWFSYWNYDRKRRSGDKKEARNV